MPPFEDPGATGLLLDRLRATRNQLIEALLAPNTRNGYRYDWQSFEGWCKRAALPALPAVEETVSLYIGSEMERGMKTSTIRRRIFAVAQKHRAEKLPSPVTPVIHDLLRGARRLKLEPLRQAKPLDVSEVRRIATLLIQDGTPIALRNRAIIVTGFASALRSASIAALTIHDLEITPRGVILHVRKEKQDQEGKGRLVGLPCGQHVETCPLRSIKDWLSVRGEAPGALFSNIERRGNLSMQAEWISLIVKAAVERIGLDPRPYSSHSLRAGFITAAGEAGAGDLVIADQTGHRDMSTLQRYFRRRDVFRRNACELIGL